MPGREQALAPTTSLDSRLTSGRRSRITRELYWIDRNLLLLLQGDGPLLQR